MINYVKLNLHKLPSISELQKYPQPEKRNKAVYEGEKLIALAIQELPQDITELTLGEGEKHLQYLNLSGNEHLQKITFAVPLAHLKVAYLEKCGLTEIEFPAGFDALEQLYLHGNQLAILKLFGNYPKLSYLELSNNKISDISFSSDFSALQHLYLDNNRLKSISFLESHLNLQTLSLRKNQLETLPKNLGEARKLTQLYLHENPFSQFDKSLIASEERKSSAKSVLPYLRGLAKESRPNHRAKMIIVGNGRVGKTTLFKRLANIPIDAKEPYTHGISVKPLYKTHLPAVKTEDLWLSVWDFGGQQIYYAAHQFFLSENALYILAHTERSVAEAHKDKNQPEDEKWRDLHYWLENIQSHAPKAEILLAQTHYDCHRKSFYKEEFEEKYGISEEEYIRFDWKKRDCLEELQTLIVKKLNAETSLLGREFPASYYNVITAIEERKQAGENFISWTEFVAEICPKAEIETGFEAEALDYLHKTGLVVHIDTPELKEKIYINPDWLTEQVYLLINNDLAKVNGEITDALFVDLLAKKGIEKTEKERKELFYLLQNFKLIFEDNEKKCYIVPQYLPHKLPHGIKVLYEIIKESMTLRFAFRYTDFMPDNVMIHFLAEYGPYAKQFYWRNGLCFVKEDKPIPCIVECVEEERTLLVYTQKGAEAEALQREIFKAFSELGKKTKMDISLDGKLFIPIKKLKSHCEESDATFFKLNEREIYVSDYAFVFGEFGRMKMSFDKQRTIDEISKNNLEKAFELLLQEFVNDDFLISNKRRYFANKEAKNVGIILDELYNQQNNLITKALLDFINTKKG
jgi:GTPase SAR1 family protein